MPIFCNSVPSYDRLLNDLNSPSIDKAWALVNQAVVDKLFLRYKRKLTGVRYLDQSHAPCCPGSVLLVRERSFKQWVFRHEKPAIFSGQLSDFYDQRMLRQSRDLACLRQQAPVQLHGGKFDICFRTDDRRKEVKVTLWNPDVNTLDGISPDKLLLDLDNFTNTGFCETFFYLVTHTVTVDRIRIKVFVDGETNVFDETVSRTVGFAADRVRLSETGTIKKIQSIMKRLPIKLHTRKEYEILINNLLPNQSRFGGAVGDINGPEDFASSARLRRLQRMRQRIYDQQNMERLQDLAFNPSVRSQSLSAVEIV